MFQPFEQFKVNYIERLLTLKHNYFVSQTYTRATDHLSDKPKTCILLTDYDDLGLAKIHHQAVSHDKYASIIDLTNGKHNAKLKQMLEPSSTYCLYWSVVKDLKQMENRLNNKYSSNMRRFIETKTNWRVGSSETISPSFQVTFGELYITLKRGSQTIRVNFVEIEKS